MQGQIGKPTIKLWCARATECERRRMSGRERERLGPATATTTKTALNCTHVDIFNE